MSTYNLPYFGNLDLSKLEEYYDVDIDFEELEIQLDLNFEGKTISTEKLDAVKTMLEKLAEHDRANRAAIDADFTDGDTVAEYIGHHIDELDEETLHTLIDPKETEVSPQQQLLSKLHLVRVGLYPDNEEEFAVFDYSIDPELTDHIVVVFTNSTGEIDYMTIES